MKNELRRRAGKIKKMDERNLKEEEETRRMRSQRRTGRRNKEGVKV